MSPNRVHRNDDGSALALALIFILVVGILVSVGLTKSASTAQTGYVVRDQTKVQYAADAGIDRALQVLRGDLDSATPSLCTGNSADPSQSETSPTSLTNPAPAGAPDSGGLSINGHTVQYTCQTLIGSTSIPGSGKNTNYAIVTTGGTAAGGGSGAFKSSSGTNNPLLIKGAVYIPGTLGLKPQNDLQKLVQLTSGDFVEYDQGDFASCMSNVNSLVSEGDLLVNAASLYSATCGAQTPLNAVPAYTLATPAPNAAPAPIDLPTVKPTCRVFLPGTYTAANFPTLLSTTNKNNEANYFVSGLYYFKDIGPWVIDTALVYGGQPNTAAGDLTGGMALSASGCSQFAGKSDTALKTAIQTVLTTAGVTAPNALWSHGTEFVMGGNSTMQVKKAAISLYTPDAVGSDPPVSLLAVRTDQWFTGSATKDSTNYKPWNAGATPVFDDSTASNGTDVVINGKLLAPDAPVYFVGTEKTGASARYGIVASTLSVDASAAIDSGKFSFETSGTGPTGGPPPQRRTVKITATVDATSTSGAFTETAIATIENFGKHRIRVYSWKVD